MYRRLSISTDDISVLRETTCYHLEVLLVSDVRYNSVRLLECVDAWRMKMQHKIEYILVKVYSALAANSS
jgi:hypothetical protein